MRARRQLKTKATAASTAPSAAAASATGDKWRFVWHNNQWWYYQPNGSWLIHDGSAWHAPQAVAVVRSTEPCPPLSAGVSVVAEPSIHEQPTPGRRNGQ